MKTMTLIIGAVLCSILVSCDTAIEIVPDANLVSYDDVIKASLSESEPCVDPQEWSIHTVPTRCGGVNFVYSNKIDKEKFIALANQYSEDLEKQLSINPVELVCLKKTSTPGGVECKDGKPSIIFQPIIED